ncbi:YmiA family putative membrane protein [Erwinia amylovora]|nr:YmiA family putative membrane protein [Erwinia amylovora]
MATRISVQPDFGRKAVTAKRSGNLKRKAWMAVFAGCALFWAAAALSVWHIWGNYARSSG